jgi:hypothetical protein
MADHRKLARLRPQPRRSCPVGWPQPRRDRPQPAAVADLADAHGNRVLPFTLDVTQPEQAATVHDRPVKPAGDMMVDGVIPLGDALRPLGRWRPSTRAAGRCREPAAVHRCE